MAARGGSPIPIESTFRDWQGSSTTVPLGRLWLRIELPRRATHRMPYRALLDTGAPLCVVPFSIHDVDDLQWQSIAGPWPSGMQSWAGALCEVGRIQIWLPLANQPPLGPYWITAKFPERTPPSLARQPLPILIGLNFFAETQSEVSFQCYQSPNAGTIQFP